MADPKQLTELLVREINLRFVEPHLYSVLPSNDAGSAYDDSFGTLYDRVACSAAYNRLVWGYSTSELALRTDRALHSSTKGVVLDLGCGSLAFTAQIYSRCSLRPVVLMDQSLKLLRMAKARMIRIAGTVPGNMVFLHGDALRLPFVPAAFQTVIVLNLLHVLERIDILLKGLKTVLGDNGTILFTTLIRAGRTADRYLKAWENAGQVVVRSLDDLRGVFASMGFEPHVRTRGNMAFLQV